MLWQCHDGVWRKIRWFLSITVRQQIRIFTLNLNRFKLTHLWLFWRQEYQMCCITYRFSLLWGSRCKGNLCNITSKQKEMFERNWKKKKKHNTSGDNVNCFHCQYVFKWVKYASRALLFKDLFACEKRGGLLPPTQLFAYTYISVCWLQLSI